MGLFPRLQVCVCVRAVHLSFLVEALFVTVGYADASRVEDVGDFKIAHDAFHLPTTRPLEAQRKLLENGSFVMAVFWRSIKGRHDWIFKTNFCLVKGGKNLREIRRDPAGGSRLKSFILQMRCKLCTEVVPFDTKYL